jgi:hypothetical protein
MHPEGMTTRRLFLVLLLIGALLCAQAASLASEHSHAHSTQHCCTLCHSGPLPFIQPAMAAGLTPGTSIAWLEWSSGLDAPHDTLLSSGSSRAPPLA